MYALSLSNGSSSRPWTSSAVPASPVLIFSNVGVAAPKFAVRKTRDVLDRTVLADHEQRIARGPPVLGALDGGDVAAALASIRGQSKDRIRRAGRR
jgi:hypothetical protein